MTRRVLGTAAALLLVWCAAITHQAARPALAAGMGSDTGLTPAAVVPGMGSDTGLTPGPPQRLRDTGLYADASSTEIAPGNRPFAPQYPLWTDGLSKRRWIYLPAGAAIDGRQEHDWQFPVGTKLWKEFAIGGRPVETRLLWKVSETAWTMASYVWNAEGTEAVLAPDAGLPGVAEVAANRRHSIPSRTDCAACHGTTQVQPLGFTALQLSPDRDPNAIHGEPLQPGMLTLTSLVGEQRLSGSRPDLLANPPRIRTEHAATRAVLGYLVGNCSMCHNGKGEIAALGPVIRARDLVEDGDAVARALPGQRTKWQVPGVPDGETVLVEPGAPDLSALLVRMRSRAPSSQMPPLGTVVRDQAAVDAVTAWIADRNRWHGPRTIAARSRIPD